MVATMAISRFLINGIAGLLLATTAAQAHNDGCSRAGDAAGISCQLRAHIHCSGNKVRVTQYAAGRYCKYDPSGRCLVTAHRTLPKGTPVRMDANGNSITVIVADRGPFTIAKYDLSHQAAHALGIGGSGCVTASR